MGGAGKTLVQFGAGSIGRSLVGQLFSAADYAVVFVDTVPEIIAALNSRGKYLVRIKDTLAPGQPAEIVVANVRGINAGDVEAVAAAVAGADVISTAVGAAVLPALYPVLARGIAMRTTPVSLLLCENLRDVAAGVRAGVTRLLPAGFDVAARIGFVETSIGKMVPIMPPEVRARDPLEVWAEAYNEIIADQDGFVGPIPRVPGLVLKRNFAAYVDRKLFVHNLGHAAAAYLGFLAGKTMIWECMDDQAVCAHTRRVMQASAVALAAAYPQEFSTHTLDEHINDLLRRFHNRALGDTVYRVGRDLARKLAPDDRCIGALRLVVRHGGDPAPVCRVIAAAFLFNAAGPDSTRLPGDVAITLRAQAEGIAPLLREVCGFDSRKDAALITRIVEDYAALEAGAGEHKRPGGAEECCHAFQRVEGDGQ